MYALFNNDCECKLRRSIDKNSIKMSWLKIALTSSIGRKLVMSLTGLFLIVFLVTHLVGNISLLYSDGTAFNEYAHFMKHNTLIIASEYILFAGFILHIVQGIMLVMKNKAARKQKYVVPNKNSKVSIASKIMGPMGIVMLLFLILHLMDFFFYKIGLKDLSAKYPQVPVPGSDIEKMDDLFSLVRHEFRDELWHVISYPIFMIAVAVHLSHGFSSAFQSLGLNHKKYTPFIQSLGLAYSIIVPLLFALIPILMYLGVTIG